jgi:hypothetical protein
VRDSKSLFAFAVIDRIVVHARTLPLESGAFFSTFGNLNPELMLRAAGLCLLMAFLVPVLRGQELPFEIEVEDWNVWSAGSSLIGLYGTDSQIYLNNRRCLFSGGVDSGEFVEVNCPYGASITQTVTNGEGVFRRIRSVVTGHDTLYYYGPDRKRRLVIGLDAPIGTLTILPSKNLIFDSQDKMYVVDKLTGEVDELFSFEYNRIMQKNFGKLTVLGDVFGAESLFLTDGTKSGTYKVKISNGDLYVANVQRSANHIYFRNAADNSIWRANIDGPPDAVNVFSVSEVAADGWIWNFQVVGSKVFIQVNERTTGKTSLYSLENGNAVPVQDPTTGENYEVERLYFPTDSILLFTGGNPSEQGIFQTNGTKEGTRLVVDREFQAGFTWTDIASFDSLAHGLFAVQVHARGNEEFGRQVILIDVLGNEVMPIGRISADTHWRRHQFKLNEAFVLTYGEQSIIVDRRTFDASAFPLSIEWPVRYHLFDSHTLYLVESDPNDRVADITAIGRTNAEVNKYQLPTTLGGKDQFVDQLFGYKGEVYAVGVTASYEHRLYRLGQNIEDVRLIAKLPNSPASSDN